MAGSTRELSPSTLANIPKLSEYSQCCLQLRLANSALEGGTDAGVYSDDLAASASDERCRHGFGSSASVVRLTAYARMGQRRADWAPRYYRRDIQRALGRWRKTTRVEKVLILLLDSGLAYCLILVRFSYSVYRAFRLNFDQGTSLAVTFKVVKYGDPAYHITLNIATSAYHSIAVSTLARSLEF